MAVEEKRILRMFYLLSKAGGYIRANELAKMMQVSERTVKSDMEELKGFVRDCGCGLESVRGKGYCLRVTDQASFQQARERVEILFNNLDKGGRENQLYHIARAVMRQEGADAEGYFRVEDLADRLYVSGSALKKEMPGVREFLGSFNLSLAGRPGRGIKLEGDEFRRRLCILELYENHFRKRVVMFRDMEYEQAFADREDKDRIRKLTLDALRESDNEVFDIYANRLVDYLLLLRNRVMQGRHVGSDEEPRASFWKEIEEFPEHGLAKDIARKLAGFQEFSLDEGEVSGIALLLLLWGDWEDAPDLPGHFPAFYQEAVELSSKVEAELSAAWNIPFARIDPSFSRQLIPGLLRLLIQMHYGFSQCRLVGNSVSDNAIKDSPLAMALADFTAGLLAGIYGKEINEYSIQLLAVRMYAVIAGIQYPYIPRRLLICARNGIDSARLIGDAIVRRFGDRWIGRLTVSELYEARKFPVEEHDCLIGSFQPYAYRYSWPYIDVDLILRTQDYERIRREIVVKGFDLDEAAEECSWDVVQVHKNFTGSSIESILQLLAYQWGSSLPAKEALAGFLQGRRYARTHRGVLTVLAPSTYTKKQILELYLLKKPFCFRDENVRGIVFLSMDFRNSPVALRFTEHILRHLTGHMDEVERRLDSETLLDILTEIIRDSL